MVTLHIYTVCQKLYVCAQPITTGVAADNLSYGWTGPQWKGRFWLVPLAVPILQYGPLRWTAHKINFGKLLFQLIAQNKQFFVM